MLTRQQTYATLSIPTKIKQQTILHRHLYNNAQQAEENEQALPRTLNPEQYFSLKQFPLLFPLYKRFVI